MNIKQKKQSYFNAASIADQNSGYTGIDDQELSLPWEMHFFSFPLKKLDIKVKYFCHRSGKSELLLVDENGVLWRYYTDIDRIQKTKLQLDETIISLESIEGLLIVQFKDRIEARSLANGQIIWSKEATESALFRKADDTSVILYEPVSGEILLINGGGEITAETIHQTEANDVTGFGDYGVSLLQQEQTLHIQDFEATYTIDLPSSDQLVSAEMIDSETIALLLFVTSAGLNKLLIYTLIDGKWDSEDSLLFRVGNLCLIRRDCKGHLWYLNEENQIGYAMQDRQYLPQDKQKPIKLHVDSLTYGNRWHRLLIDYDLPDECAITIDAAASNEPIEPLAYTRIENLYNDLLLPALQGEYLYLRIYLTADQSHRNSPVIRSIKLLYPRSTYLEYMPACYRESDPYNGIDEDEKSVAMLERFLSIFETTFATLEEKRESTPLLIDSAETSKETLAWLSSWLGLKHDDSWEDARWRQLMREAPGLFGIRGTREAIERVIEIYSGIRPLVYEPMHARCMKKGAIADMDNYSFCLFLKPEQYHTIEEVETIRRIVEEWKPAYTKARVVPLENRIVLGSFLFLGVNTKLERGKERLGEARMPFDGVAVAGDEDIRALERVRIGNDAILH